MGKTNLLDLDNDVLNIIGNYVKADNIERIKEEKQNQKMKLFQFVDEKMKQIKIDAKKENNELSKHDIYFLILLSFNEYFNENFDNNWDNDKELHKEFTPLYDEYFTQFGETMFSTFD